MWLGFCGFFLYNGRFSALLDLLPRKLRPAEKEDDGSISVLVYFFQMAAIALPIGKQKLADGATNLLCVLGQFAGMQQVPNWSVCTGKEEDSTSGICVGQGTTATATMVWPLAIPLVLSLLLFCVVNVLNRISDWYHRRSANLSPPSNITTSSSFWSNPVSTGFDSLSEPATARGRESLLANHPYRQASEGSVNENTEESGLKPDIAAQEAEEAEVQSRRIGASRAVVKMLLFSYGGFVTTTFRLLHCVPVCNRAPVSEFTGQVNNCIETTNVLFYAGEVKCGTKQLPFWLLLLLVFSLPILPILLWLIRHIFPSSWRVSTWVASVKYPQTLSKMAQATKDGACAPFRY